MGRVLTADRLAQIHAARVADPDAPGPILAELIIEGNVPVETVASLLSVSEPTIYRWMYGDSHPRDKDKIEKIRRLLTILRKAKRARDLPLAGTADARAQATIALVHKYRPAPRATV